MLIFLHSRNSIATMPTSSNSLSVGNFSIPPFALPDVVTGKNVTADAFAESKGIVIVFLCRHCPYVDHVLPTLLKLAGEFMPKGIAFVGISANDASTYPDDSPEKLREMAVDQNIPFPILFDGSQNIARSFQAACTPEFFVFDRVHKLFYHGRMDASTPGNNQPCTGNDLRSALDSLLTGANSPAPQHPSMGCSIKWK